jgi:hypothetical protein
MKLIFSILVLALLIGSVGAVDIKLDINVYKTINSQGTPVQEQPSDNTPFMFYVTWTHTIVTDGGQSIVDEYQQVGTFVSSQDNVKSFPEKYGAPYGKSVSVCTFSILGECLWYDSGTETGQYVITPVNIPYGYCPLDPFQTRKAQHSGNSPTVVEKFYFGEYCSAIGYKSPVRPQILIQ